MYFIEKGKKLFNSAEEVISMFLGLAIVVVVISLVFTYFQSKKGDITLPGVSNYLDITEKEDEKNTENNNNTSESNTEKKYYEVKSGDTLWKIAETNLNDGFAWTEIAKVNNISNPRLIAVGQKLEIPVVKKSEIAEKPTITEPSSTEYTVTKDDSLWKIAVKTYGDGYKWVDIWNANKNVISNPGMIYSGTKLTLPSLRS